MALEGHSQGEEPDLDERLSKIAAVHALDNRPHDFDDHMDLARRVNAIFRDRRKSDGTT